MNDPAITLLTILSCGLILTNSALAILATKYNRDAVKCELRALLAEAKVEELLKEKPCSTSKP